MSTNPLKQLGTLGQSVWYDNIHRDMLTSGELARLVETDDLRGVTSNPTIFDKAISGGDTYDDAIAGALRDEPELSAGELFNHVAVADIRDAADVLRPVHDRTGGTDGMVSMEVSPALAHDTDGTVAEARRLWAWLDRPNVMVKVPATAAGVPAIETLINDGINVNVTLLFSLQRYAEVVDAYLAGLQQRARRGEPVAHVRSVASFFVSRVDTAVDPQLGGDNTALQGKAAIANAQCAYAHFESVFDGDRFADLRALGAQEQRLLWASTGTKNPDYSDIKYVEALIGDRTVNTLPPATYDAYKDHGAPRARIHDGIDEAPDTLAQLEAAGIDLRAVTDALEVDGVQAFLDSYNNLLRTLNDKAGTLAA
ncbi:transaldolase [Aquisalimonas asiatica]|uniref:Transaldolase n=1 Tax=Aquisalimonas asiatica TaxID=406100 RepID=A0A1H8VCY8_9GAMM|nr:transaldolase [Aquisalimonas asiatica]SEP13306.1 transaldolase [Aquisalimonas asiatica]